MGVPGPGHLGEQGLWLRGQVEPLIGQYWPQYWPLIGRWSEDRESGPGRRSLDRELTFASANSSFSRKISASAVPGGASTATAGLDKKLHFSSFRRICLSFPHCGQLFWLLHFQLIWSNLELDHLMTSLNNFKMDGGRNVDEPVSSPENSNCQAQSQVQVPAQKS